MRRTSGSTSAAGASRPDAAGDASEVEGRGAQSAGGSTPGDDTPVSGTKPAPALPRRANAVTTVG